MNKLIPIGTCCVTLVVAGCGSSNDSSSSDTGAGASSTPAAGGGAGGGKSVQVTMKDVTDNPMNVTVSKGGTVKWTNKDPFDHTVTKESGPGPSFDSGNVSSGKTFSQKFTTAGTINYRCTIHPNQTGVITVK